MLGHRETEDEEEDTENFVTKGLSKEQLQAHCQDLIRREGIKRKLMISAGKGTGSSFGDFEAIRDVIEAFEKNSNAINWLARPKDVPIINGIQKIIETILSKIEFDSEEHYTKVKVVQLNQPVKKKVLPNQEAFRRIVDDREDERGLAGAGRQEKPLSRQEDGSNQDQKAAVMLVPREPQMDLRPLILKMINFNEVRLPQHKRQLLKRLKYLESMDELDYRRQMRIVNAMVS